MDCETCGARMVWHENDSEWFCLYCIPAQILKKSIQTVRAAKKREGGEPIGGTKTV